jgi:hypothetical protein
MSGVELVDNETAWFWVATSELSRPVTFGVAGGRKKTAATCSNRNNVSCKLGGTSGKP